MDLTTLIRSINPVNGRIHPAHYEAYCSRNGNLDAGYLSHVCKARLTQKGLNSQVNHLLGAAAFVPDEDEEITYVTHEEFADYYSFARHSSVRDYIIDMFDQTGKVLTQENLFRWVQELE